MTTRSILLTILNIISTAVGLILGLRVIFLLVGANPATPIIGWINSMSDTLLYPFSGLFQNISLNANSTIDVTAIVALLVYAIIFSLLYRVVFSITHDHGITEVHSHA